MKFDFHWKVESSVRILVILSIILLINYFPKAVYVASTINANPNLFLAVHLVYFKI